MQGVPVVFLPGASGRSSYLRPVSDRLAHRGVPILIDYPGLGDVPPDPAITSLSDLYRVVSSSLPERFDLVALSMGCVFALRLAIEQPHRLRRLVLVAPAGGIDVHKLGATDWRDGWRKKRPDAPTWFLDDKTNLTERLRGIHAPTLIIGGDRDPISPPQVGEFLRDHLPHADLRIVTGGTHDLEHEYPEMVAGFIDAHLDAHSD